MNGSDALIECVLEAGRHIRERAFDIGHIAWKSKDDPVTDLDCEAERIIDRHARRHGLNLLGEEGGFRDRGSDITLHVDPVDGTKSLVRREFRSSVSVGIERIGSGLVGGFVYDFMKDILYAGIEGDLYLQWEGKKYPFRQENLFCKDALSIDKPFPLKGEFSGMENISVIEKGGSIALSMAELASGSFSGLISGEIGKGNSWDVAAGQYLLETAGLRICDYSGRPFDYKDGRHGIVAVQPRIAESVARILSSYTGNEYGLLTSSAGARPSGL